MSTEPTRILEFQVLHDVETSVVRLAMVVLQGDGERVRYEGEGTYRRWQDQPRATLSIAREPISAGFGDPWIKYVLDTPTMTTSCEVGDLRVTKPVTRTVIAEADPRGVAAPPEADQIDQKLIEEEERRGI